MLYVLCIEVLALQITVDPHVKSFLLPSVKDTCFKVHNYADDTTTFLRDLPSLAALFDVVSLYERLWGKVKLFADDTKIYRELRNPSLKEQ